MKKFDNIVIKNDETEEDVILDKKRNEAACTLTLIKLVLNNPMDGVKPDGAPIVHHYTVEEMDTALSVMGKVKGAIKAGHNEPKAVKTFELEDGEVVFVEKFVRGYKPLFTGLQWAPFIKQFVSK